MFQSITARFQKAKNTFAQSNQPNSHFTYEKHACPPVEEKARKQQGSYFNHG